METFEFNFDTFVSTLMKKMEMENAPKEVQESTALEIRRKVGYVIMDTVQKNLNTEELEKLFEALKNNIPMQEVIQKVINDRPDIQEKLTEEMDKFYNETLEVYNTFKK